MQAPALRPAGKPERDPGSGASGDRPGHGAAAGPERAHGPPSQIEINRCGPRRPCRDRRCIAMATITKLRNKIERVSALNGWRMRWHMQ
jgi:hypothetical protein